MNHQNISGESENTGWKSLLNRIVSHCERTGKNSADFFGAVWANVSYENDVPVRISAQFTGSPNGTEQITVYLDADWNVETMRSVRSFDKFFENGESWWEEFRCIHSCVKLRQDFDSSWIAAPAADFELPEDAELVIQSQTIAWTKETRFAKTHLFYAFDRWGGLVPRSGKIGEYTHFPNESKSFVREVLVNEAWTKSVRPDPMPGSQEISSGVEIDSVVEWNVPYSVEIRSNVLDVYLGGKKLCDFEIRNSFDFATLEERFFPKTGKTKNLIEAVATRVEDSVSP